MMNHDKHLDLGRPDPPPPTPPTPPRGLDVLNTIVIRCIDSTTGRPVGGAIVRGTNPIVGNFACTCNPCGEYAAGLTTGTYDPVTINAIGYTEKVFSSKNTPPDQWVISDSGIVTIELAQKSVPITEPTRDQVCNIYCGFQGITIHTEMYGNIPAFGPETSSLSDADLISYCAQMKALGFTHVEFDISWNYVEQDYQYPVPGRDLSNNLEEVCRRCALIINQGMMIKFALAGDGLSKGVPGNRPYNDPQGWTYGYEWLMENLERILTPFKNYQGRALYKWIEFVPGYDGVFYGWSPGPGENPDRQPERVMNFGQLFRQILPDGYLGIEHTPGNIPIGEGSADYRAGGRMDDFDTILSEYDPWNLHQDSTWQILGRFCRPYNRPADQPIGDDPRPDYYLLDNSRGKRFYIIYEYKTYRWVRGCPRDEVIEAARYLHAMAPLASICGLMN